MGLFAGLGSFSEDAHAGENPRLCLVSKIDIPKTTLKTQIFLKVKSFFFCP